MTLRNTSIRGPQRQPVLARISLFIVFSLLAVLSTASAFRHGNQHHPRHTGVYSGHNHHAGPGRSAHDGLWNRAAIGNLARATTTGNFTQCGKNASPPGKACPLSVCCSEFGFCGTTSEFCAKPGCQSHCDQPKPDAAKTDSQKRIIGYWQSWNGGSKCGAMAPSEIPVDLLTHLVFSFAFITPSTFEITNATGVPLELFGEITKLKQKNPELKVIVALGGWSFNDPGPWQMVFHDLASTKAKRAIFIKSLLQFLDCNGFDGVDFDWEYPGAPNRGGQPEDGVNFSKLLKELRSAIKRTGKEYIVTVTVPTAHWYLQHFDLKGMIKAVDWIHIMSYDLHGVWDKTSPEGPRMFGHTNITDIDLALNLLWRNNIPPEKLALGLAMYGRTFKLADPTCWRPGCMFSGAGDEGECTKAPGMLSYKEVTDIIQNTNAKPHYDESAGVTYLVYGDDNWISYDDPKTYQMKIDYANNLGISGLVIWAVDLDSGTQAALNFISPTGNNRNISLEIPKNTCTSGQECGYGNTTTTPTSTGGTAIPSPVRDGMAADCNTFYLRGSNSSLFCADIANENHVTLGQFLKWNPAVKSDCSGLWPNYYYCVGAGSSNSTSTGTPTTPPPIVTTTMPSSALLRAKMGKNCKVFYLRDSASKLFCGDIAKANNITLDQFYLWNPDVGSACGGLWPDYYYCVGV